MPPLLLPFSLLSLLFTGDYYTNGIHVTNSWKVHNISKNKWFVLIAKSHEQKQFWVDAIRRVRDNRKSEWEERGGGRGKKGGEGEGEGGRKEGRGRGGGEGERGRERRVREKET